MTINEHQGINLAKDKTKVLHEGRTTLILLLYFLFKNIQSMIKFANIIKEPKVNETKRLRYKYFLIMIIIEE